MRENFERPIIAGVLNCALGSTDSFTVPVGEVWVIRCVSGSVVSPDTSEGGTIGISSGGSGADVFVFTNSVVGNNSYTLNTFWVLDAGNTLTIRCTDLTESFSCYACGTAYTVY